MPIIDKAALLRGAFSAARSIHSQASHLRGLSGSVSFDDFAARMDSMRQAWGEGGQPLLDLGTSATVNAEVGKFFAGAPLDTYGKFTALRSALVSLYTAYDAVFASLTPIQHSPAGGHVYAAIPVAQLASLADELDAVIAAADPVRS